MKFDRFGIVSGLQFGRSIVCDETAPTLEQIMAEVPNYADESGSISVVEILAVDREGFATEMRDIFCIHTYIDIGDLDN